MAAVRTALDLAAVKPLSFTMHYAGSTTPLPECCRNLVTLPLCWTDSTPACIARVAGLSRQIFQRREEGFRPIGGPAEESESSVASLVTTRQDRGQQDQGNKPGQGGQQNQGQRESGGRQQSGDDKSDMNRKET